MKQLLINKERKYHGNYYSEGWKVCPSRHNYFASIIIDCDNHRDCDQ
ncbi:MAG: hypothetical protein HOK35_18170 [Cytophagia bacterium]|nr:hypothetical protein [Cytophagia bacterium]